MMAYSVLAHHLLPVRPKDIENRTILKPQRHVYVISAKVYIKIGMPLCRKRPILEKNEWYILDILFRQLQDGLNKFPKKLSFVYINDVSASRNFQSRNSKQIFIGFERPLYEDHFCKKKLSNRINGWPARIKNKSSSFQKLKVGPLFRLLKGPIRVLWKNSRMFQNVLVISYEFTVIQSSWLKLKAFKVLLKSKNFKN